ncbi:MAG TPA: HlyD family efflux transporter periplasmic adaptor subunit [Bacteroidales bacterium]|nr:HlyD family efflux transporter periplasmic adaptor subunit [Bacteroidales bacterium]HOM41016.1 HlyD family efflux transporter periplasmic adaptor subunit [Bacteroidales bacterium]
MKKSLITTGIVAASLVLLLIVINYVSNLKRHSFWFTEAMQGRFEVSLTVTGEIIAENSVDILAPSVVQEENHQQQQGQQQMQQQGQRQFDRGQGGQGGEGGTGGQRMQGGQGGQGGGGSQGYIAGVTGGGSSRSGSISPMLTQGSARSGTEIRLAPLRITDLVPEGTIVKKGDYIGQLDRTEYDNTLKSYREQLTDLKSQLELRILDSSVVLSGLRDDIKNQIFLISEAEMKYRNSKYEAPDVIRKAEINLEKAKMLLDQKQRSYILRKAQIHQTILNLQFQVEQLEGTIARLEELLREFTIRAPIDGMVVYKRDQLGNKRRIGSMITPFDRVVATIPDMSVLLSKVYVSEIDVSKISVGLPVEITLDAFPNKRLKGTITSIANIGETLPNADTKVYETIIKIEGSDPDLRPTMTTTNKIIIKVIDNTVYIPAECLHSTHDSIPFVYTRSGLKQIVIPGDYNEKMVEIKQGLKPGTRLYLIEPEKPDRFRLAGKELIPAIREINRVRQEYASFNHGLE